MKENKLNIIFKIFVILCIILMFPKNVKAYDQTSVLNDLAYLETIAENYKTEYGINTDTKLLVSTYIRNGAYDDTWNKYGGITDTNFENYVNTQNPNLSYLKNVYQISMSSGEIIDFKRLISDLNILINKGSVFGSWVSDIYDLAIILPNQNMSADDIAKTYYNSFSSSTCLTNIDAYNIYKKYGNSLSETIKQYYNTINNDERYRQFVSYMGVGSISKDAIRTSVLANFKNSSEIVNLLNLRGLSFENNQNQLYGAAYAYADYIYNKHPNKVLLNDINFNTTDFSLNIGEEKDLNITTIPEIDSSLLTLSSSAPEVISIVNNKKIRAISEGTAVITCSYAGISKSLNISVIGILTNIKFDKELYEVEAGSAIKLEPITIPKGNTNYSFSSSNPEIAEVDKDGNVFSFKGGKTFITCKSNNDSTLFAKCEINVTQTVQELSMTKPEITLTKGELCKLGLTIVPEKHSDKLIYSSSDESIVKIDTQGNITAKNVGEAIITCMSETNNEIKADCKVIVTKSVEKIQFEKSFQALDLQETPTIKLNVILTPSTANTSNLIFEISDKKIASLDTKTMTLTLLKQGTFTITCKSKDDENIFAKCNFYVRDNAPTDPPKKTTPTINDKEAKIEVSEIIDKGDTIVKKEHNIFDINFIKKVILIFVIVAISIILIITIIAEILKRNKHKILNVFGFKNDFNEADEDEDDDIEFEYKEHIEDLEKISTPQKNNKFHNVYKVYLQSEKEFMKMDEDLIKKQEELLNEKRLREIYVQEIEEEMEEERKRDLED